MDARADENIAYVQRRLEAGVPTGLQVYPGAFHGFEGLAPAADVSQHMAAVVEQWCVG